VTDRSLVVNTLELLPGSVDPGCSRIGSSFVEYRIEDGGKIEAVDVAVAVNRTVDAAEIEDNGGFAAVEGLDGMMSGIEREGNWCRWD
jgi:hypothetical protein